MPRSDVKKTVDLSMAIWGCFGDIRALLGHASSFRDQEIFEPRIIFWLQNFTSNLLALYPDYFDRERMRFYQTQNFKNLVTGLTHDYYRGFSIDENGKLWPPKDKPAIDPMESLASFATAGDDPTAAILAAKPRE